MWIVGNWKMNGTKKMCHDLVTATFDISGSDAANKVILCPPFPFLMYASFLLDQYRDDQRRKAVFLGAQNCHTHETGAFTGETSAAMLQDCGVSWVIVGHSERRSLCHETDTMIHDQCLQAFQAGLGVILCVGETLDQRESGQAFEVVMNQLSMIDLWSKSVKDWDRRLLIAYEPVWAIGTGKIATSQDISSMHAAISEKMFEKQKTRDFSVLYGGSVKPDNVKDILETPHVSGVLVGGASIDPLQWRKLLQNCQ